MQESLETLTAPLSGSKEYSEETVSLLRRMAEMQQNAVTEINFNVNEQTIAQAMLPTLIAVAAANGTPIVNA